MRQLKQDAPIRILLREKPPHKHLPGRAAAPLSDNMVFCEVVLLSLSFTANRQERSRHRNVTGGASSCA